MAQIFNLAELAKDRSRDQRHPSLGPHHQTPSLLSLRQPTAAGQFYRGDLKRLNQTTFALLGNPEVIDTHQKPSRPVSPMDS